MIETIKMEGFVRLELYDKNGKLKKKVDTHNFIAKPLKHYILKNGIANILEMNSHVQGQMITSGAAFWSDIGSRELGRKYNKERALTNFVLNLDATQASGMSANSHFVNIWNADMTAASKVLGYCNMNDTPLADGKEGQMMDPRPVDQITPNVITKKFKYADGVATGTINCVMMASKNIMLSPSGDNSEDNGASCPGIVNSKLLDQVDIASANFSSLSNRIIPPGVKNGTTTITDDDEIIINYSQDSITRHKVNLTTGVITEDTSTFPFPYQVYCDYKVIGDYVYYLRIDSGYCYMDCYQISTGTEIYTNRTLADSRVKSARLLYDSTNDILYITSEIYNTSYPHQLTTLTKSGDYYYNKGTQYNDYSQIATFETGFDITKCCIGNYGSNYALYMAQKTTEGYESKNQVVYLFSDLDDVNGSIYDCIPVITNSDFLFKNASAAGILGIGKNGSTVASNDTPNAADAYNQYYISNSKYPTANYKTSRGAFYTVEGDWANFVSLVVLTGQDIIQKGATDVLTVVYGYRIITT